MYGERGVTHWRGSLRTAPAKGTMPYDPEIHHRRSIRLRGYDYSQPGGYFVTICTEAKEHLFGQVVEGEMHRNEFGDCVVRGWKWLAQQYSHVVLDEWIVMPNHLHGIIVITDSRAGSNTADSGQPPVMAGEGGSRTALPARSRGVAQEGASRSAPTKHFPAPSRGTSREGGSRTAPTKLHPDNRHVRDKIRQQLQVLHDLGFVEFLGRGRYRCV